MLLLIAKPDLATRVTEEIQLPNNTSTFDGADRYLQSLSISPKADKYIIVDSSDLDAVTAKALDVIPGATKMLFLWYHHQSRRGPKQTLCVRSPPGQ